MATSNATATLNVCLTRVLITCLRAEEVLRPFDFLSPVVEAPSVPKRKERQKKAFSACATGFSHGCAAKRHVNRQTRGSIAVTGSARVIADRSIPLGTQATALSEDRSAVGTRMDRSVEREVLRAAGSDGHSLACCVRTRGSTLTADGALLCGLCLPDVCVVKHADKHTASQHVAQQGHADEPHCLGDCELVAD